MTEKEEKKLDELQKDDIQDSSASNDDLEEDMENIEQENVNNSSEDIKEKLAKKEKECEEYLDLLRRTKAEFDNYRKRTTKEKDGIYDDGFIDGVKQILPVIDNLERAMTFNTDENSSLFTGVEMVLKMFNDTLAKNKIEIIPGEGEKFDPEYHNAVMHIEDESLPENVIVEVLQKGYKYKEKIIRYSMVKVAN